MEVVLIASVLSTSASYVIENILSRCGHRDRATTVHHDSRTQISVGNSEPQESSTAAVDQSPQQHDSVKALEDNLTELRAAARAVNSADTFVQYARLTREANALEERISAMKGLTCCIFCCIIAILECVWILRIMFTHIKRSRLCLCALQSCFLS